MPAEQAQNAYLADDLYWSADLVAKLENRRTGMALDWAIECLIALLENTAPSDQQQQLELLTDLSLSKHTADSSFLMTKSQQIWYEKKDLSHVALAHLYVARAYLLQSDSRMYRTSVITALRIMGNHEFYRQTSVAVPLSLFKRFESEAIH
jgi:hypothetical protein